MFNLRRLAAGSALAAVAFSAAACGGGCNDDSYAKPQPDTTATAPYLVPNPLHWLESRETPVPASLDGLRRGVEEIGYGLAVKGFTPISENVDNPFTPTALVTQWLSPKGDAVIELHSSSGVTGISVKRADKNVEPGFVWYRCTPVNGLHINGLDQLKKLQPLSVSDLKLANCHAVTYG